MHAIGYKQAGSIDRADALVDLDLPVPLVGARDLLVEVEAISVNPVDVKIRQSQQPTGDGYRVLGWDASGTVREVGSDVSLFRPGDNVFYSGAITRPGANSELHLIDERLVGRKPASLDWAEAAAMPLTGVTAWEVLFDRLDVRRKVDGAANALLVVGGAGGVGSMAIQLARTLTDLTVIATASRPETREWVEAMGAHHVIDHSQPLPPQIEALGLGVPGFVFSTTQSGQHRVALAELMAPEGRLALIDDPKVFDIVPFKSKSISVHWELMYTRSLFPNLDMGQQGRILGQIADLADAGRLRSTLTERLSPINVANLKLAHTMVESAGMRGKVVLEGWT
jgi:NADPH:quinone reductase